MLDEFPNGLTCIILTISILIGCYERLSIINICEIIGSISFEIKPINCWTQIIILRCFCNIIAIYALVITTNKISTRKIRITSFRAIPFLGQEVGTLQPEGEVGVDGGGIGALRGFVFEVFAFDIEFGGGFHGAGLTDVGGNDGIDFKAILCQLVVLVGGHSEEQLRRAVFLVFLRDNDSTARQFFLAEGDLAVLIRLQFRAVYSEQYFYFCPSAQADHQQQRHSE